MTIEKTKVDNFGLDELKACPWCGKEPLRDIIPKGSRIELKIHCYNCKVGFSSYMPEVCSFGTMIFGMKKLNDKWNERV
jgi:hypothetical protein